MTWLDDLAGQKLAIAGTVQSPRKNSWNFVSGVTAVYNASTGYWDLTVSGGGGSAHTIKDESSALTQRTVLRFNGSGVTAADSGGETVVTIPGLPSPLPVANGGTGLTALGTTLQAIRVNAGATALEYYTPSSGGGGMGFRFTYSTTTTDADPGAGIFRGNNAALASVTQIYVDLAEYGGTDVTAWLDSLDDYSGAIKGVIRLSSQSNAALWIEYTMTAWTTATGYRKLTVAYKDGPGGLLTTAGDTFLAFDYASTGVPNGSATGQTLVWNGSAWAAGALDLADADARTGLLPDANLANGSACSVLGRSANSSGVRADMASTTVGHVMRIGAGPVAGFGSLDLADADTVGSSLLPHANIANGSALSLFGRSANSAGVMAAITGTEGQVPRISSSVLQFGQLDLGNAAAVSGTLGQARGGTGFSGAGGTANRVLLTTDGTSWVCGQLDLATAQVQGLLAFANIANGSATSLFGRSANSSGVQASIAASVDGQVPTRQSAALSFGNPNFSTLPLNAGLTVLAPPVATSGTTKAFTVTGAAHTNQTLSAELVDVDLALNRTVQFATGALTTQRASVVRAPTYGFVGASTITTAATFAITGAPVAGTNATITNSYALWVQAGKSQFDGALSSGTTATLLEANEISGRGFVGINIGVDITATELPSTGGDNVTLFGATTTAPTAKPVVPAVVSVQCTTAKGLAAWSSFGIESTVAPGGESTSATRKLVDYHLPPKVTVTASATQFTAIEFDCVSLNDGNFNNGVIKVRAEFVAYEATNGYSYGGEAVGVFERRSGTLALEGSVQSCNETADGILGTAVDVPAMDINTSGTSIRLRITPGSTSSHTWFATMQILAVSP